MDRKTSAPCPLHAIHAPRARLAIAAIGITPLNQSVYGSIDTLKAKAARTNAATIADAIQRPMDPATHAPANAAAPHMVSIECSDSSGSG